MTWPNFEKTKHILVIDDHDAVISTFKIIIEANHYMGHYPNVFDVKPHCQLLSNTVTISMIFIDYQLPGYTGVDLIPTLETLFPHTPIIGMSSCCDARQLFINHGILTFLNKPFNLHQLQHLINHRST